MKLYEVPRNSFVRVIGDIVTPPASEKIYESEILKFYNVDGMYSRCQNARGEEVYLFAGAEVEIVK